LLITFLGLLSYKLHWYFNPQITELESPTDEITPRSESPIIMVIPTSTLTSIKTIIPSPRPMENGKTLGNPKAPVIVEVYEDFQCPSCALYSRETESKIVEEYVLTGKVYYIFHHFPLLDDGYGKESDKSANASMCALEQGRFWEYHDYLFENQNGENKGAFSDERLVAFAEILSLDMPATPILVSVLKVTTVCIVIADVELSISI
jgi:hypothetical protein